MLGTASWRLKHRKVGLPTLSEWPRRLGDDGKPLLQPFRSKTRCLRLKRRFCADHLPPPPPFWFMIFRPFVAFVVPHKGGWAGHPSPTRMTTPGNLIMTIFRQGLTTLLHVIGALALLASLDPTLTKLHAQNLPLKPFNPVFNGCPPPNTSPKACIGENRWQTTGVSEGLCGNCGIKDFSFLGGICNGPATGSGEGPICRECKVNPGWARDTYSQVAAPQSEAVVCLIGLIGASGSLAVVACLATVGTGCWAALAFELGVGSCVVPYCNTNCLLTARNLGDPQTACVK